MAWNSQDDFQELMRKAVHESGGILTLRQLARTIAEVLAPGKKSAEIWLENYLSDEVDVFSATVERYPVVWTRDASHPMTVQIRSEPLRVRGIEFLLRECAPYLRARLLSALYAERAVQPPFPTLEDVASEVGMEPEVVADSIRIASFLPPRLLFEAEISWSLVRVWSHEVLVHSSLQGDQSRRIGALHDTPLAQG